MESEKTELSKDHLSSATTEEEGEQVIEQKITQTDHDAPVEVEYIYADGESIRLSRMEEQELVVVAIKKAAQEILDHTALIKELTGRIEELEAKAESASDELECINRVLDAT